MRDIVGVHQFEQHFSGCIFRWDLCSWREREAGIMLPDVNVRIDERNRLHCREQRTRG
jgi:hypothetical protein